MKKIIVFFLLILLWANGALAVEIVGVIRRGGQAGGAPDSWTGVGYYYVNIRNCTREWVSGLCVTCTGPGSNGCPALAGSPGGSDLDQVDVWRADDLIQYADQQIASGTLSGTHLVNVQISGENCIRVYTVSWTAEDRDASGNWIDPKANNNITIYKDILNQ